MDYAIRTLTQRWAERLTELAGEREFLTMPEVAGGARVPEALAARIGQILSHQFRGSMDSPVTEWAELDRPEVAEAWRGFLAVAEQELRLPVAYVTAVVETAVSDVMELVLQPRVAIPQALFGDQETKSLDKLRQAADAVVVNGRLAYAVVRYMEREGLAELSVQKAAQVVQRVDEKLVEGLSDEQLMGLLDTFFELFEGDGDPAMLCLFFEDKEMMEVVRRLEEERSALDRAGLLEMMRVAREDAERGAESLAFVGLGEDVEEAAVAEEALVEGAETDDFVGGMESGEEEFKEESEPEAEPEPEVEVEEASEPDVMEEVEHEQDEEPESAEQELEESEEPLSIAERFAMNSGFQFDEESEEDEEEVSDTSAWLSGAAEESVSEEASDQEEDLYSEESEPEPARKELSPREHQIHIAQLSNWLAPDSDRFIESIFRGSEERYKTAIEALSACNGWKAAASYIKEEIFDSYDVELTDPVAADFTDGMQSYFEEFKG